MRSKLGTLKLNDFWKGFVMAVLMTVLDFLYQYIGTKGTFQIDWNQLGLAAGGAALAYLIKNLGTGAGGKMLTNTPPTPPPGNPPK